MFMFIKGKYKGEKMKTAIVTGSSSGFGKLIAIELARKGYNVIATMRDIQKSDNLIELVTRNNLQDRIHIYPLDVTSPVSIGKLETYVRGMNSVDILVNNAGYAQGGFCEELSIEAYRHQFETNFFGAIAVTKTILPAMRSQGSGKIINMSSISGRFGFPGLSAYASSKYALEGFSESLRLELKPFGIDVILVEPGSYKTNIWASVEEVQLKERSPYAASMTAILHELKNGEADYGDPKDVAKLIAKIACNTGACNLRYPIGKGVGKMIFLKNLLPWKTIEKMVLKKLY